MSDPQRLLLDATATDLERELLGSWQDERPPAEARAKTLAMLGLGTGAIVGAATVGGSIAPKALATGGVAILKWIALGALALAGTAAIAYVRAPEEAPAPATVAIRAPENAVTARVPPPLAAAAAPSAPAVSAPLTIDVENLPAPSAKAPEQPKSNARPLPRAAVVDPPEVHGESGLSAQISAIDRARAALRGGDPKGALAGVDDYEARFPGGAFGQEAEVLRVEALLAAGDRTSAGQAGARFLAAHPASPHAAHVRALLGGSL